jgi:hypothetical protein
MHQSCASGFHVRQVHWNFRFSLRRHFRHCVKIYAASYNTQQALVIKKRAADATRLSFCWLRSFYPMYLFFKAAPKPGSSLFATLELHGL